MLMLYRTLKEHEDFLKIYKYVDIYTLEEYKNARIYCTYRLNMNMYPRAIPSPQ